jgi:hypothetical protein
VDDASTFGKYLDLYLWCVSDINDIYNVK